MVNRTVPFDITKPYPFTSDLVFRRTAQGVATYSISGNITQGGTIVGGVSINLTGSANGATLTDAGGNYTFTGLQNGTYTVTPLQNGYTFTPASRNVTINSANVVGQNFTRAVAPVAYTINGRVEQYNAAVRNWVGDSGVTINISGVSNVVTDVNGNFVSPTVTNGTYTLKPTAPVGNYKPPTQNVIVKNANVRGVMFRKY